MEKFSKEGVSSFIVRIYRQPNAPTDNMAGLVEKVGTPEKIPFKNKEELWEIMQHKPKGKKKTRKSINGTVKSA